MMDQAGQMYFLEVNTVPGLTETSLVPKAAEATGMGFDALVLQILSTAKTSVKEVNVVSAPSCN